MKMKEAEDSAGDEGEDVEKRQEGPEVISRLMNYLSKDFTQQRFLWLFTFSLFRLSSSSALPQQIFRCSSFLFKKHTYFSMPSFAAFLFSSLFHSISLGLLLPPLCSASLAFFFFASTENLFANSANVMLPQTENIS